MTDEPADDLEDPFVALLAPGKAIAFLPDHTPAMVEHWEPDDGEVVITLLHAPDQPITDDVDVLVPTSEIAWRVAGQARMLDELRVAFHPVAVTGRLRRRSHSRVRVDTDAQVAPTGPYPAEEPQDGTWRHARTVDISAGGIALVGPSIEPGTLVLVRTVIPGPDGPIKLSMRARVVHRMEREGEILTGYEWAERDLAIRARIAEAVLFPDDRPPVA